MDADIRQWTVAGLRGGGVSVADAWGQVELGGVVRVDTPVGAEPLPDLGERIVDASGGSVADGEPGEFVLTRPWAGTVVGVLGAAEALEEAHWTRVPGAYATGDRARRHADGRLEFLGRTDEVVSVSGQLVSLSEVRTTLEEHPYVAAAEVVERGDHMGARVVAAVVVPTADAADLDLPTIARELGLCVRESLGGLARPRLFLVLDRIGDEIPADERRRALAGIPLDSPEPRGITWGQVLAVAGYAGDAWEVERVAEVEGQPAGWR
jgi:acetyl-CoA synthetase